MAATDETATLKYPGGELDLNIVHATEGADGIALGSLLSKTGYTTFDNGFVNTASTKSAITYIDGDAGILRYRGIPIDQLAEKSTFIEVSYLLIYGELPTTEQLADFTRHIQLHTMLHEDLKRFFDGFPRNAHPMPVLSSAVNALSAYYPDSLEPHDHEQVELSTIRLLAKLPTIAAYAYKKSVGQPFLYPDNSLTLVENFLRMTFGLPAEPYDVDPEVVKALDMLLILHADHEQNCSTSTVRLVGSSQANLFTSISGGINALWGPLHGGANQAVLEMLEEIHESDDDVAEFVRKVKNSEEGVKLMGFGHRVYKNYDPRATHRQGAGRQDPRQARWRRRSAEHRQGTRRGGAHRRLLHRAQAVPQRRLLHRPYLPGARLPHPDVHRAVRAGPAARLDRALAGDARRGRQQDRPSAPDLHRLHRARLQDDRRALVVIASAA